MFSGVEKGCIREKWIKKEGQKHITKSRFKRYMMSADDVLHDLRWCQYSFTNIFCRILLKLSIFFWMAWWLFPLISIFHQIQFSIIAKGTKLLFCSLEISKICGDDHWNYLTQVIQKTSFLYCPYGDEWDTKE